MNRKNCRKCKFFRMLDTPNWLPVCKTEMISGADHIGAYKEFANPKTRNPNGDCRYFERAPKTERAKFLFWEYDVKYMIPILNYGERPRLYE